MRMFREKWVDPNDLTTTQLVLDFMQRGGDAVVQSAKLQYEGEDSLTPEQRHEAELTIEEFIEDIAVGLLGRQVFFI